MDAARGAVVEGVAQSAKTPKMSHAAAKATKAAELITMAAAVATVIKQNIVLTVSKFVLTSYFIDVLLKLKEFI